MPVTQADLSLKSPVTSNDVPASNGGRLTNTTLLPSIFPDVTGAERAAGLVRFRKAFTKNEAGTGTLPLKYSDATLALLAAKAFFQNFSPANDRFLMKAGTPTGFQSGVVDSGWAGAGYLEANVSAGAITLQIRCENAGSVGEIFQCSSSDPTLRTVLISDVNNNIGNREFVILDQNTGVSWGAGPDTNLATLTFTSTPLQHDYKRSSINTSGNGERTATSVTETTIVCSTGNMTPDAEVGRRVRIKSASTGAGQIRRITINTTTSITIESPWTVVPTGTVVYEVLGTIGSMCVYLGDVKNSFSGFTVTCGGGRTGAFNSTSYLKLFPVGTMDDHWTILFSSPTAYTITGTYYGQIGSTYLKADTVRPVNGASYYFELDAAGWSGTWDSGDTVVFDTVSSSKALWLKEIVPAGIDPHSANSIDIGVSGDTV
jgi:hypothetical protein